MPKYSKEVKALSAAHLKQLLKATGIQKQELAAISGRSAQTVSAMVKGTAPVTERTAQAINATFPEYSIPWLMGLSEYPNGRSEFVARVNQMNREGELMGEGFYALATLMGYSVVAAAPPTETEDGHVYVEQVVNSIKAGYIVTRGKDSAHISFDDMHDLQNEIADFVDFKLGRLFKERG